MKIYINNQAETLLQPKTVWQILEKLQMQQTRGLAIAVNNQIVSKTDWQARQLQENDRLTLIRATQGG